MESTKTGSFSMSSEAEQLARLREWPREGLAGLRVDRPTQAALVLAGGELCADSIEHAYDGRGGQPINVSLRGHEDRVVIEVTLAAQPMVPESPVVEPSHSVPA